MILSFSPQDLDRILQIENASFPKSPYNRATFIHLYDLYPQTFLIDVDAMDHREKGKVCGYHIFSPTGHILSIAVHPQHRRRGIGRKLLEKALHFPNITKVWAEIRESNKGSQAFFLSLGFEIVGRVPNYYGIEDALILKRILSPSDPIDMIETF